MGDYTRLIVSTTLESQAVAKLDMMLRTALNPKSLDAAPHDFFQTSRWMILLKQCAISVQNGEALLTVEAKLKDYEDEIDKFCDWISPFIAGREEGRVIGQKEFLAFETQNCIEKLVVRNGVIYRVPVEVVER